jgi:hypothetical protein
MRASNYKSTDQLHAEALTKSIRAEGERIKREGTREEAIIMLKKAGILNRFS